MNLIYVALDPSGVHPVDPKDPGDPVTEDPPGTTDPGIPGPGETARPTVGVFHGHVFSHFHKDYGGETWTEFRNRLGYTAINHMYDYADWAQNVKMAEPEEYPPKFIRMHNDLYELVHIDPSGELHGVPFLVEDKEHPDKEYNPDGATLNGIDNHYYWKLRYWWMGGIADHLTYADGYGSMYPYTTHIWVDQNDDDTGTQVGEVNQGHWDGVTPTGVLYPSDPPSIVERQKNYDAQDSESFAIESGYVPDESFPAAAALEFKRLCRVGFYIKAPQDYTSIILKCTVEEGTTGVSLFKSTKHPLRWDHVVDGTCEELHDDEITYDERTVRSFDISGISGAVPDEGDLYLWVTTHADYAGTEPDDNTLDILHSFQLLIDGEDVLKQCPWNGTVVPKLVKFLATNDKLISVTYQEQP